MPRSAKDSDEESEIKSGRKIRTIVTATTTDSPLRRSSRIKQPLKQNEVSPDSVVNDATNSTARVTRRRTGTMDSNNSETHRTLRSRKNSISSDISESAETEIRIDSPVKRNTRSLLASMSNESTKSNVQGSKRRTRAGSETKSSPPTAKNVRKTRASSMGPESIEESKVKEKFSSRLVDVPIKMKRRTSILPSEATVAEESEEKDNSSSESNNTLPEIDNSTILDDANSFDSGDSCKVPKLLEDTSNECKKDETSNPVRGPVTTPSKIVTPELRVCIVDTISLGNAKLSGRNYTEVMAKDKKSDSNIDTIQTKSLKSNVAIELPQFIPHDASEKLELTIGDLSNISSVKETKSPGNKENENINIVSEVLQNQNKEIITSNVIPLSPKSFDSIPTYKSVKESKDTSTMEHALLKQCSKPDERNPYNPKRTKDTMDTSINDENQMENNLHFENDAVNKLPEPILSCDEEGRSDDLDKTQFNVVNNKNQLMSEINTKVDSSENVSENIIEDEHHLIRASQLSNDVSSVDTEIMLDESIKDSETRDKPNEAKNVIFSNVTQSDVIAQSDKNKENILQKSINSCEHVDEIIDETTGNESEAPKELNTEQNKSNHTSIDITIDQDIATNNKFSINVKSSEAVQESVGNIDKLDEISNSIQIISETTDCVHYTNASMHTDKDKSDSTVKNGKSSIVTESRDESTQDVHVMEGQSNETEENTVNSNDKSTENQQISIHEGNSANSQEIDSKNQQNAGLDTSDFDTNVGILFQDISADEWKKERKKSNNKRTIESETSSVHSVSTEKLENESEAECEAECDLVLVDKDVWQSTENEKSEKGEKEKEKEIVDYDSDDTVILKNQLPSLQGDNRKVKVDTINKEDKMDVDTENEVSLSDHDKMIKTKRLSLKKSESPKLGNADDPTHSLISMPVIKKSDSTIVKEDGKDFINTSNISSPRIEATLLRTEIETEELTPSNELIADQNSDEIYSSQHVSKNEKILNESLKCTLSKRNSLTLQDPSVENQLLASEKKSIKKRSLSKSQIHDNNDALELSSQIESPKNGSTNKHKKRLSHDGSLNIEIKPDQSCEDLNLQLSSHSNEERKETESENELENSYKSSDKNKRVSGNYSTVVHIGSDSEENTDDNLDSSDAQLTCVKIPKFLFDQSSKNDDESSNQSINSDINKEYNLEGKTNVKYSDDDVPGDICRASESESSDTDDNGSDLADFVVNDDEIEDEEESEEREDEEEEESEEKEDEEEEESDEEEVEEEKLINVEKREKMVEEMITGDEKHEEEKEREEKKAVAKQEKERPIEEYRKNNKQVKTNKIGTQILAQEDNDQKEQKQSAGNKKPVQYNSPRSLDIKKTEQTALSTVKFMQDENSVVRNDNYEKNIEDNDDDENTLFTEASTSSDYLVSQLNEKKRKLKKCIKIVQDQDQFNEQNDSEIVHAENKKLNSLLKNKGKKGNSCSPNEKSLQMSFTSSDHNNIKSTETSVRKLISKEKLGAGVSIKSELTCNKRTISQRSPSTDSSGEVKQQEKISKFVSSKNAKLNKTNDESNLETKITRDLMKEKLNESLPVLKLNDKNKKLHSAVQHKSMPNKNINDSLNKNVIKKKKRTDDNNTIMDGNKKKEYIKEKPEQIINTYSFKKQVPCGDFAVMTDTNIPENTCESIDKKKKRTRSKLKAAEYDEMSTANLMMHNKNKKENNTNVEKHVIKRIKTSDKEVLLDNNLCAENASVVKKKKRAQKLQNSQCQNVPNKVKETAHKASTVQYVQNDTPSYSDQKLESIAFSQAQSKVLEAIKQAADSIKTAKDKEKRKLREYQKEILKVKGVKPHEVQVMQQIDVHPIKKGCKRLSNDVLENLSDVPPRPRKKQKLNERKQQIMPSRSMSESAFSESNINMKDSYVPISSFGSTTQFNIISLKKLKKPSKQSVKAISFKGKMFSKNKRLPISTYMSYVEKRKASNSLTPFDTSF